MVRWLGTTGYNATMIFNHRIDADYRLPNAGFRPVKITYRWEEDGAEKTDVHVARTGSGELRHSLHGQAADEVDRAWSWSKSGSVQEVIFKRTEGRYGGGMGSNLR